MLNIVNEGKKVQKKPAKKASKKSPKKKIIRKLPTKSKPAKKAQPVKRSFPMKKHVVPVNPPVSKAVKLKSSSRDGLAIPAYGFIDVCFCLDATGSMAG